MLNGKVKAKEAGGTSHESEILRAGRSVSASPDCAKSAIGIEHPGRIRGF